MFYRTRIIIRSASILTSTVSSNHLYSPSICKSLRPIQKSVGFLDIFLVKPFITKKENSMGIKAYLMNIKDDKTHIALNHNKLHRRREKEGKSIKNSITKHS